MVEKEFLEKAIWKERKLQTKIWIKSQLQGQDTEENEAISEEVLALLVE